MKSKVELFIFASLLLTTLASINSGCNPEQIHLSFGDAYYTSSNDLRLSSEAINENQAYLVWQTPEICQFSVQMTEIESKKPIYKKPIDYSNDFHYKFDEHNNETNNGTFQTIIYTTLLENLAYDTPYQYEILNANDTEVAGPFSFTLPNPHFTNISKKVLLIGGIDNPETANITIDQINTLITSEPNEYAGMIQLRSLAFYPQEENGTVGNIFFTNIPSSAAVSPLIAATGSHGEPSNPSFTTLQTRNPLFDMTHNNYFSFNLQGIHFLSINFDFYETSDHETQQKMLSWIKTDLTNANTPAQRELWPWIVVVSHQPIYCADNSQETPESEKCYNLYEKRQEWDSLFSEYKVDLMISGHNQNYARLSPILRNASVEQGQSDSNNIHDITNPTATVYIIEGAAGNYNQTQPTGFEKFVDNEPGYGVLYTEKTSNGMKLVYEHYVSDTGDKIDYVNLIKTKPNTEFTVSEKPRSNNILWIVGSLIGLAVAVVVGLFVWKRMTKKDPEVEKLKMSEYRSNKLYGNIGIYGNIGGKNSGNTISMVDLVL